MKSLRASVLFALAVVSSIGARAADYKVLIDVDDQVATGCSVTAGSATFPGVEQVLTTTVDTVSGVSRVTRVVRQVCDGTSLGAAITVDEGGWSAGADAANGNFLIETHVPLSVFANGVAHPMRIGFLGTSGSSSALVVGTDAGTILFPASPGRSRSVGRGDRSITLDGNGGDWANVPPLYAAGGSASSSAFRFNAIYAWPARGDFFFRFDVQSQPAAPTARNDSYSTAAGVTLTIAGPGVLANDTDPNGKPLTAVLDTPASDGVLELNSNGSFTFVPDPSKSGITSFRYKASNGDQVSNAARVDIGVGTGVPTANVPPVATDDAYAVAHRGTLNVNPAGVLTNDVDAETDPMTAEIVTQPLHGTLTFRTDGSFTYKHDGTSTRTDSFTYVAKDGHGNSNVATVAIAIGADAAPVAVADSFDLLEGATLNVGAPGVFANDTDKDTPQTNWTVVVTTPPAHGTVNFGSNGSFTYTNDSVTGASDSFQYRVNDRITLGNIVTVTLNVTPVNDAPTFTLGAPVTVLDTSGAQSIQIVLSANGGASDELGQAIDYLVTNDNNSLFSVQPTVSPSGVVSFTPIAGMSGIASLTIRAHDNGGLANGGVDTSAAQNHAVNVEKIPSITSANTTTFAVSQFGTFTVTTDGLPKPSIAQTGALPAGVTFVDGTGPNKGTGVLSGTPAPGTGGSYPITFQATNPHGSSPIQNFTLIVNQPAAITSPNSATFTRNSAGTFTITTTGFPTPALTETGAVPAGLTFTDNGNGTATLGGTPTAAGGIYSIVVNATNGVGSPAQQTLTITINEAPTITSGNSTNFQAGTSATFTVTTTGFPAPSLGESGALPNGITFTDNGDGTATLGGNAVNGSGGTYTITITATNVAGSAPQTFTITVCNNIVVTAPGVSSATAGSAFNQSFTQTGAVGTPVFATTSTLPNGMTLSSTGVLSGTPTQTGTFPIVVTVTDSLNCTGTSATYNLVVGCQVITVTNPANTTGVANAAFSETFTQSGAIGGATFTTSSTLPTGLSLSTAGVLSGTPTQTGSFPIVVTVTDGNGCTGTSATYTLTITCQTITVTNPANTTGVANAAFSETFTESGSIGGATFTTSSTLPAGLALSTAGVLSGTPTQTGTFPIVVTVTDSNGCTGTSATYNLTITCQTITVTNPANTNGTAGAAFSETFTQSGAIGTAAFTTSSTLPNGITLATNGVLSGTPTQTGSFPIVVTVTDANGCTGTGATYTLVIACQTITVTNPSTTTGTVNAAFSQTFTQTGGLGTVNFTTSDPLPNGLTLATNGVLSGIPTQTGSFPIVVTATDQNGCTGVGATYTLVIGCQTITVTNPVNNTGPAGSPFSETFTQTGAFSSATFTTSDPLPTGLTLSTAGVLSGTPTQGGTFPIVVTVTDANGCTGVGGTYNLTITCPTITVTNPANSSGTAGVAFSETFTQSGGQGTITWSVTGALPSGITLNPSTGVLSGTTNAVGSFPITVTATDQNGCTGTGATYTLTIACQTVTVTNPGVNTGTVDAAFTQTFTVTGILGTVTWSETGALPAGITLDSSTGVLSGTPTVNGVFPITVKATDTNGCFGTSSYTLTISCQTITVTNPGVNTGTVDAPFSQTFTQTGAHGTAVFTTLSTLPAGLSLAANGLLSGTPTVTGSFPIDVTVTDDNNCTGTNTTYNLTIGCQVITVTNPATTTGTTGTPFSQFFTQSGAHGTATFSTASTLPTGFTLNSATGELSGTTNQHTSFSIVVTVTDSNTCTGTSATYNLTINCQTISVTNPVNTNGTVNAAFSETFTQTGAIGSASFTTASTLPNGLTLHAATGVLDGTPTQSGSFPIVVTVTDSNGCTGVGATYTLVIACNVITVTSPVNDQGTAGSAFNETFTQTGGTGTITWSVTGTLPSGITLNTSTGVLSGVTSMTGIFPITVTATDSNTCSGTSATYNLTINCQTVTVTNPGVNSVQAGTAFDQTFTVTGILGTVTWSSTGTLPTGITLNSSTGHLAGTTTQQGTFPIVVKATDTNGCFGTSNYTLTVTCPTITVARTGGGTFPAGVFNTAYTGQSLTATGGGGSYTFAVTTAPATFPTGLSLSSAGVISGTPSATGSFTFTVEATDTGSSCTGSQSFTINIAPSAVNDTYGAGSNLVDNTQFVITGGTTVSPTTPFVGSIANILANDLPSGGVTATAGVIPTTAGGSVTLAADGTFIYTPKANPGGAITTSDSFSYTVVSNSITSAPATVGLTLANRVWYVKNNGGGANGQSQSPFQTLAAAQAASIAGDIIYVYNGNNTFSGQNAGITLKDTQQLIGEGVALVVNTVSLVPAGNKPLITNIAATSDAVTLASNNVVKGLIVQAATRDGIRGTGVAGFDGDTLTFKDNVAAGLNLLNMTNGTSGSLNLTNSIVTQNGTGLLIDGGTATINVNNTNSMTNLAGQRTLDIRNRPVAANAITIAATINDSGTGILVQNNASGLITINGSAILATTTNPAVTLSSNTGATINFGGIMNITTTTGTGFDATGGGTLNITGTVNVTTGAATNGVNVSGVTAGASGVTFNSVNTTGATVGVAFNSLGNGNATINGGTISGGTTGLAMGSLGTSTITLANVTFTGSTTAISGNTFGTLAVGTNTVNVSGVQALNLTTGAVSGLFNNVSSTGSTNGVNLAAVTGTWTVTAGTLTGASGATFNATGTSTGSLTWNGSISQANAGTAVTISGTHVGTINFNGNVTASGTSTGISISSSSGTYNFNGATNSITGSGGGVAIANESGNITFSAGTNINTTTIAVASFSVTSSSATITYSGTMTNANNGGKLLNIDTYSTGTLTIGGTSLTGSTGAPNGVISTLNSITGTVVINNLTQSSTNNAFNNTLIAITGTNTSGSITFNHLVLSATGTGHNGKGITAVGGGTLNITATGGASSIDVSSVALDLNGQTLGGGTVATVNSSGGVNGIKLTGTAGSLTVTAGSLAGNTGAAFLVAGGAGGFTYGGSITQNTAGQRAVDITGKTGGTIALSGAIGSSGGTGVFLNNNTSATINISGNMTLSTGAANAFTATGGGTVNVTGASNSITTANGIGINWNGVTGTSTETFNTVTSTTGQAVSVTASGATNFTIGTVTSTTGKAVGITTATGTFTFTKISSNGANTGVSFSNAAAGGIFVVNGTGGLCDATHIAGTDCTGGTIQGGSTRGVDFTNVGSVTLKNMYFLNTAQTSAGSGACKTAVGVGTTGCSAAIYFNNITDGNGGTTDVLVDRVFINGTKQMGIAGTSMNGMTLTNTEVMNTTFAANEAAVTLINNTGTIGVTNLNLHNNDAGGTGMLFVENSAGTMTLNVTSSIFNKGTVNSGGINAASYNSANMTVNIQSSAFGDVVAGNGLFSNGVTIGPNDSSVMNATVNGNTFNNTNGLRVNSASNAAFTYAVTNNNPIFNKTNGSNGLTVGRSGGTGTTTGTVTGNVITRATCGGGCAGIRLNAFGASGSTSATMTGNNISGVDGDGILFASGQGATNSTVTLQTNTLAAGAGATGFAINAVTGTQGGDNPCVAFTVGGAGGLANPVSGTWRSADGNDFTFNFDETLGNIKIAGYVSGSIESYISGNNPSVPAAKILLQGAISGGSTCP